MVAASAAGFALANSVSTGANEPTVPSAALASLAQLKREAHSLDRPRGPADVLPAEAARLLSSLPTEAAEDASMLVIRAAGIGDLYAVPASRGFAVVSTAGVGGTVPSGLSDSNPVVGGTLVRPDGRLVVLGIVADSVTSIRIRTEVAEYQLVPNGNGLAWLAPSGVSGPDEIAVFARLDDGRVVQVF